MKRKIPFQRNFDKQERALQGHPLLNSPEYQLQEAESTKFLNERTKKKKRVKTRREFT